MGSILNSEIPSFKEGYDAVKKWWPDMPNKDQGSTFACVGNGWAHYKQVLQAKDTGEHTELSAKSIYNPIAMPRLGSYIRDGGLRTVNYGVNKEAVLPSDKDETSIVKKMVFTDDLSKDAAYFKNYTVGTVNKSDFDSLAKMIYLNEGFVGGWAGHCMYFKAYGILNGKRYLKTHNSYGPGSDLYYFEGSGTTLYSQWTAVDIKNMPNANTQFVRLVREVGNTNVYAIFGGKRYLVWNPTQLQDYVAEGLTPGFSAVEEISTLDMSRIPLVKMGWIDFLKQ